MRKSNATKRQVEKLLKEAGIQDVTWDFTGRGHHRVTFQTSDGTVHKHVLSTTGSCYRGEKNAIARLRASLRGHVSRETETTPDAAEKLLEEHPRPWRTVGALTFDANNNRVYL